MKKTDNNTTLSNRIGLILFGVFYLISCIMVLINSSGTQLFDSDTKVLRFAHWNLEDGFREGFGNAIKEFEELKAKEGVKVKIIQTTVPIRGYRQWLMTQLIGGDPADIMKYLGDSDLLNQYFLPLTEYIAQPNPYNRGTPLAGVPWKDTFIDGMRNSMDPVYSEYYGVGSYFHTYRVFVNMDLLKKATGSRKLPENLQEWLDICEKIKAYGKKIHEPVIPIGVRGFDKSTLQNLFVYYLSQMNGNLNSDATLYCNDRSSQADAAEAIKNDRIRKRMLAAAEIMRDIGQYFGEGFTATDLEQTKFLFFSGKVGFFPEGTWNGYSMVKNSPFEVEVIQLPVLGHNHKFSKYYTGRISEQGVRVGGAFAIPKATKHFKLALEFLQFITSYRVNQMVMGKCKWPPAVRYAKYEGLMSKFQPVISGHNVNVDSPFYLSTNSKRKILESLEEIINSNSTEPQKDFWRNFISVIPVIKAELLSSLTGDQRNFLELSAHCSRNYLSLLRHDITRKEREKILLKDTISFENYAEKVRLMNEKERLLKQLDKIERQD